MAVKRYPSSGYGTWTLAADVATTSSITGDLTNYSTAYRIEPTIAVAVVIQYRESSTDSWHTATTYPIAANGRDDHTVTQDGYHRVQLTPSVAGESGTAQYYITATSVASTYCSPTDISYLIGLVDSSGAADDFDANTPIPRTQVTSLILNNEDIIDELTGHAWRDVLANDEYHDYNSPHWIGSEGRTSENRFVSLGHRSIQTFQSGTHKIEVWDGSSWVDYVATYTEGRNNDYWIDYTNGIVYFKNHYPAFQENSVRVTYEYGDSTVPFQIKKLCALMTAVDLCMQADFRTFLPEGGGDIGKPTIMYKVDAWRREINGLLDHLREVPKGGF